MLLNLILGSKHLISDEGFRKALYMIDIGQNDLADTFSKHLSYAEVTKRIPSVIAAIKDAVQVSLSYKGRLLRELQKIVSRKYLVSSWCHFRDHI